MEQKWEQIVFSKLCATESNLKEFELNPLFRTSYINVRGVGNTLEQDLGFEIRKSFIDMNNLYRVQWKRRLILYGAFRIPVEMSFLPFNVLYLFTRVQ